MRIRDALMLKKKFFILRLGRWNPLEGAIELSEPNRFPLGISRVLRVGSILVRVGSSKNESSLEPIRVWLR